MIDTIDTCLEVPLDSAVAIGIKKRFPIRALPTWLGLKWLTKPQSDVYQARASVIADRMGIARIHLDIYLWTENR